MSLERHDDAIEEMYQKLEEHCNGLINLAAKYFKAFLYSAGHDALRDVRENLTEFKHFVEGREEKNEDYSLRTEQLEKRLEVLEKEFGGQTK